MTIKIRSLPEAIEMNRLRLKRCVKWFELTKVDVILKVHSCKLIINMQNNPYIIFQYGSCFLMNIY